MFRGPLLALVLAATAAAASFRLYLKDGSWQVVREYVVEEDRVRYYSLERSEWEEIPLELLDLKRTESERRARQEEIKAIGEAEAAENAAEQALREEVRRVPYEPGVYWIQGQEIVPVKQAESKLTGSKRNTVLRVITPIPIVAGKSNLEVEGKHAALNVGVERPEFYIRLSDDEKFLIVKGTTTRSNSRIFQRWTVVPVSNELFQEQDEVEIFRQQLGSNLYKIWPQKPLEPGEYAVIQYTEGKPNTQVWDFSYYPGGGPPKAK
jgi:hypothetical protein